MELFQGKVLNLLPESFFFNLLVKSDVFYWPSEIYYLVYYKKSDLWNPGYPKIQYKKNSSTFYRSDAVDNLKEESIFFVEDWMQIR